MKFDPVSRPAHYTEGRAYEPIAVIEDWGLPYHLGNVVKYVSRAGRKGDHREDLAKARWYLDRYIDLLDGASADPALATVAVNPTYVPLTADHRAEIVAQLAALAGAYATGAHADTLRHRIAEPSA